MEERALEVPADLAAALKENPKVEGYFNFLPHSHRREYVKYVTEAKRSETRARRIAKTLEMLKGKL